MTHRPTPVLCVFWGMNSNLKLTLNRQHDSGGEEKSDCNDFITPGCRFIWQSQVKRKEKIMQVTNERSDQEALTVEKSASLLGLHEFSLLSRVQAGEITGVRLRSGEMAVAASELERLARKPMNTLAVPAEDRQPKPSDKQLGIEWSPGLKRNGQSEECYKVPNHVGSFTASEIESYRAAFGAIAGEFKSLTDLKNQLNKSGSTPSEKEIETPQIGRWLVRSRLLNLGQSDILLCQRADNDFAIVELFLEDSTYARANGGAEILMHGSRNRQLTEDFKANAQLTLEFMASNLTAKAQKIVWEQFPDDRPGHIVAAISERCRQAVANEETISQNQKKAHSVSRGVSI
jgi:hypothetical protein